MTDKWIMMMKEQCNTLIADGVAFPAIPPTARLAASALRQLVMQRQEPCAAEDDDVTPQRTFFTAEEMDRES